MGKVKPLSMNKTGSSRVAMVMLALLLLGCLAQWGCSDRVKGTETANQKPVVYFVNIPPDSTSVSRNPVMYWVGSDPDGQVKTFRYIVIADTMLTNGHITPAEYATTALAAVPNSRWTYLQVVVATSPDPQTSHVVKMQASMTDPVNMAVPQYVFLQAIDDKGLGSDIVWRVMFRNDNPPTTTMVTIDYDESLMPFINAKKPGGLVTGVRLAWAGSDPIDYPVDPPPFQFQWKLFGPYTYDTLRDGTPIGEYQDLVSQFTSIVFVTNDGKVYHKGIGDSVVYYCDSVDTSAEPDTTVHYACVKIFVDTVRATNSYGRLDTMLMIDDPDFVGSSLYRLVDTSASADNGWISETGDTLYNVYRYAPQTGTTQMRFLFWVRCRDDAYVADLVPFYGPVGVIEPMYEHAVGVIDWTKLSLGQRINAPYKLGLDSMLDTAFNYWKNVVRKWDSANNPGGPATEFGYGDYIYINGRGDDVALKEYLRHKVMIMYNDDANNSVGIRRRE